MKRDVVFAAGFFLLTVAMRCASDDFEVDDDDEALLTIETEDGFTIEFAQLPNGAFVVSEIGPGNAPSKIADPATQKATPLEIYLAVAPGEDVPPALEDHHATMTDEEPRDFSVSFRHTYSGEIYEATCTYTVDYDWFSELSTRLTGRALTIKANMRSTTPWAPTFRSI